MTTSTHSLPLLAAIAFFSFFLAAVPSCLSFPVDPRTADILFDPSATTTTSNSSPASGSNNIVPRDGVIPIAVVRRSLEPIAKKEKHLVDKDKLALLKKVHDKDIKMAEVTFSEKIAFFYLDEHDALLDKKKDKLKKEKLKAGGNGRH